MEKQNRTSTVESPDCIGMQGGWMGAIGQRSRQKCGFYEQPVVIPQSSHTLQVPFCRTLMEPQFSHCSPE